MNKRWSSKKVLSLLIIAVLLVAALLVTGCNGNEKDDAESKKLVVANWKGYATDQEYGADVFEELYDCEVEHYYFNSLEELMQTLKAGGVGEIDVVNINPLYINAYRNAGVLQPVEVDQLENYGQLMESFRDIDEVKGEAGEIYGVPWVWGSTALGYNPEKVEGEITSWEDVWGDKYAGKVGYFDEYYTAILTAALYLEEEDPYNPDLDRVKDALLELKAKTKTYWSSYDDWFKAYKSGEVVIGNLWSGAASQLLMEGTPIAYTYPEEGSVGWCDYWCLVKDSPNKDLAMKWIDFATGEDFQTAMATDEVQANTPTNKDVIDSLTDEQKKNLFIYPEAPDNLALSLPQTEEQRQEWLNLWNDIKAAD